MSTTHIRYSELYYDLIKDIDNIYFTINHNYEKKIIEIKEPFSKKDSLGIIFYNKSDSALVSVELKKLSSFDDSGPLCSINLSDWNSQTLFWVNSWGSVKFKMKISESDSFKRTHKYSFSKESKDLVIDVTSAPDQGLCGFGDSEDFQKKARSVLSGLNRGIFLFLSDWNQKVSAEGSTNNSSSGCECGTHAVYGKNIDPFFHSRWCRLFVDKK